MYIHPKYFICKVSHLPSSATTLLYFTFTGKNVFYRRIQYGYTSMLTQGPNSTYVMTFFGPSLKREEPGLLLKGLIDQIVNATNRDDGQEREYSFYTAFTPSIAYRPDGQPRGDLGNESNPNFVSYTDDCIIGGAVCYFTPGDVSVFSYKPLSYGRSDPLVMKFDKDYYTCALRNTSYTVKFHHYCDNKKPCFRRHNGGMLIESSADAKRCPANKAQVWSLGPRGRKD